jgi:hypothetical protein
MEWASGCSVPDAEEENHSVGDCVIALGAMKIGSAEMIAYTRRSDEAEHQRR